MCLTFGCDSSGRQCVLRANPVVLMVVRRASLFDEGARDDWGHGGARSHFLHGVLLRRLHITLPTKMSFVSNSVRKRASKSSRTQSMRFLEALCRQSACVKRVCSLQLVRDTEHQIVCDCTFQDGLVLQCPHAVDSAFLRIWATYDEWHTLYAVCGMPYTRTNCPLTSSQRAQI